MKRDIVIPENKQHWLQLKVQNGTSTEAAALFGKSPYTTYFETWHRKKQQIILEIEESGFMKWGNRLEPQIAAGVAEDNHWPCRKMSEFISIPDRIGSSFDYCVLDENNQDRAILEIKNVNNIAFKQGWLLSDDGNAVEAPIHIELQVQQQMLVSGLTKAYIAALVGGNTVHLIERDYDPEVGALIADRWASFWESIDKDIPPDPDFEQDAEYIQSLFQGVRSGTSYDGRGNEHITELIERYKSAADLAKKAEESKQAAKAELLTIIGDHEKAFGDGWKISAGLIAESKISYTRKSYRDFRIYLNNKE